MPPSPEKQANSGFERTELSHPLEEPVRVRDENIDVPEHRMDETIPGMQKRDKWLIPEEMKKRDDDPPSDPVSTDLPEWEVNGSGPLAIPFSAGKWKNESEGKRTKDPFDEIVDEMKSRKPNKVKEWIGRFFRVVERSRRREVEDEVVQRKVSLKLGLMTGRNEMSCDFCEVHDRFYLGALFADIYVDGQLKWVMCPNCLGYCREQSKGSLEQNVRARFNHLAHRLEQEARRARSLAVLEDIRVPNRHEWEAWETASYALKEVASTMEGDGQG